LAHLFVSVPYRLNVGLNEFAVYLQSLSCSIVIVAHDRDFLDSTCEETIILKDKQLTYFESGLTNYERDQRKKRKGLIKSKEARDRRKVGIEKSIQQGAKRAKETGDQTLQSQVKMRKKKLETRWGVERNEKVQYLIKQSALVTNFSFYRATGSS